MFSDGVVLARTIRDSIYAEALRATCTPRGQRAPRARGKSPDSAKIRFPN